MDRDRPKRYLVIGSDGHGRGVRSHRWDKLPDDLNVADYDVVILNFAAFEDKVLAEGFPVDRLPGRETMARLLFAPGSEIVAIGDPSTKIGAPPLVGRPSRDSRRRADYWLPCSLGVEKNKGTSYRVLAEEWRPYFQALSGWRWIATGEYSPYDWNAAQYLDPVTRDANTISVQLEPVAATRFEKAIGLRVRVGAVRVYRYNPPESPVASSAGIAEGREVTEASPVFWLPAPDRTSPSEAIDLILRDRYGVAAEARLPDWAAAYSLPVEIPIREEIAELEQDRRRVESQISDARERAAEAARPRVLLYEKGKEALEPIARDALRNLGARVEDPQADGVEDGTLFRAEGDAVLEVKGRIGVLKQEDVRQVVQWASDAKLRDGREYKAIIVGNPHCETPPDDRGEPLAPNAKTYAQNGDVALVTAPQIYEALRQKQAGDFDEEAFWKALFDARGLADLPGPAAVVDDQPASTIQPGMDGELA